MIQQEGSQLVGEWALVSPSDFPDSSLFGSKTLLLKSAWPTLAVRVSCPRQLWKKNPLFCAPYGPGEPLAFALPDRAWMLPNLPSNQQHLKRAGLRL